MYLAILGLPILGSIISGFFGRKVGVSGAQIITCTCVIITTFLALLTFIEVGLNKSPVKIHLFRWIDAEYLNVAWAFNFDSLTVSMLIPVLIISSLVHIYSIGYMSHDPHNQRFFSYLSLFTFMMIVLVTGDNFLVMFVGWEGVGVCSYLLVSFWFTRIAANQSSLAAFFTNRVGDYILTVGMFAILLSFGNVDYATVFSLSPFYSETVIFFIGLCLLIGAMAKSSQIGLHVWLPMAMEGPTPVSALIHAATMVTAGVYLLMRASPLIEYSSTVLLLCLWVGAITTVFSSLIGLFQQDIKKVIAYSTMSQLGMMVIAVGLSSYTIALFHLINHAFYKGLLFLCAGAVIHAVADNQDFRRYGGLISYLPLTYSLMLTASLSLVAFPFMTGFYSKDFILESAYGQYKLSSIIVYFIATVGAMFTTLYSVKVLYLTFLTNPNGSLVNYKPNKSAHEGDLFMSTPLVILGVFSIFFGYICKDLFIGLGSDFFSDNGLYIHPYHEIMLDTEFAVNTFYKLLPLFFTISLTICSILFTEFYPQSIMSFKFSRFGYNIFNFFNQRFLVEMFYNMYISSTILRLGGQTTKVLDKGAVELFGPFGLEKLFTNISLKIDSLSTGVVTSYALYIFIGLIGYISMTYYDEFCIFIIIHALVSIIVINETKKMVEKKLNMENKLRLTKLKARPKNLPCIPYCSPFWGGGPRRGYCTLGVKLQVRSVHTSSNQNNSATVEDSPSPASSVSIPEPLERSDVKQIIDDTTQAVERVRDTTDKIGDKYHDISEIYSKKSETVYNSQQKQDFNRIHEANVISERAKVEAAVDSYGDGNKNAIINSVKDILQNRDRVLEDKRNHLESNGVTLNTQDNASISQLENQRESLKANFVADNNHLDGMLNKLEKATNVLNQEDKDALISLGSDLYELKLEMITIINFF